MVRSFGPSAYSDQMVRSRRGPIKRTLLYTDSQTLFGSRMAVESERAVSCFITTFLFLLLHRNWNSRPSYSFLGQLQRHIHDSFRKRNHIFLPSRRMHCTRRGGWVHNRVIVWVSAHHRPATLAYPTFSELRSPIEADYGFFFKSP